MSDEQWTRARQLLNDLLDADPDDRAAWLDAHCGDDPALRAEVESLLRAYEGGTLLEGEYAADWLADDDPAAAPDLTGQQVGPYRLTAEIGVGGMSVVYRGERTDGAFEQTVAVKLLQRRLHSGDAEQRFRAERQVLASLDHPHIASLIDGGVTGGGRPYLVMEHVEGTPLTDYAEAHDLDLDARLDLLQQVLEAVQAAHRRLVVHRDLKPSNVLVTETEGGPRVKLLDFGIAKLLDDSMPVTAPQTETGHHLMTPAYAAPEQVTGDDVTTRTDVYQLGVLAYELLSGTRPFDLSGKSLTEIERIVMEEEPAAPSEQAREHAPQLQGDLDTIITKALRKEPDRRYRSVEALAADLDRHRAGTPIEARPATFGYRARKFVDRNRTVVGAGALIFLLGVAYAVTVTIQADRLAEQRDRAQQEAETAEQVSEMLVGLFEASNPYEQPDTLTARTLLRRGEDRISQLQDQPKAQAQLLGAMGRAHQGLGDYDRADSLQKEALELRNRLYDAPHAEIATSLSDYAMVQLERGRHAVAESLHTKALAMRRQLYGPNHRSVSNSLNNLGITLLRLGKHAAADSVHREALAIKRKQLGPRHPETAATLDHLGVALREQGKYGAADSVLHEALAIRRETLGPRHPGTATTLQNLGIALMQRSKYGEGVSAFRGALSIKREHLGPRHPSTATTLNNLGLALIYQGRYAAADSALQEAVMVRRRKLGPRHPRVATTLNNLGNAFREQGSYAEANSAYREALSISREKLGPRHPNTATVLTNLGSALGGRERYAAADSVLREAIAIAQKTLGPRHPNTAIMLSRRGNVLREQDRYTTADSLYHTALSIKRKRFGPEHPRTANTYRGLGLLLRQQGDYSTAERHLRKALTIRRSELPEHHPHIREALRNLADLYEDWGKPTQAESYRDSLVAEASLRSGS
jgi:serine/threonine-protein kinase